MKVLHSCKKLMLKEIEMKFTSVDFEAYKATIDPELSRMIEVLPPKQRDEFVKTLYHDHWAKTRQADFAKLTDEQLALALKAANAMLSIGPKLQLLGLGVQGTVGVLASKYVKRQRYQLLLTMVSGIVIHECVAFVTDILAGQTAHQLKNIIVYEMGTRHRQAFYVDLDGDQNPEVRISGDIKIHQEHLNAHSPLKS